MFYHFSEEGSVLVAHQIIKADAAADEDLFYTGQFPQFSQQIQIISVIHIQIFAGGGKEALAIGTDTLC